MRRPNPDRYFVALVAFDCGHYKVSKTLSGPFDSVSTIGPVYVWLRKKYPNAVVVSAPPSFTEILSA